MLKAVFKCKLPIYNLCTYCTLYTSYLIHAQSCLNVHTSIYYLHTSTIRITYLLPIDYCLMITKGVKEIPDQCWSCVIESLNVSHALVKFSSEIWLGKRQTMPTPVE